ncbi:MAG: prepilin peptidase [Ruminococcus sp.]|nr:prepilin peptidase [Ruminococcus sp.]
MIYLLFSLIAALSTIAMIFIGSFKGVIDTGKFNIYKPCEDEIIPYKGKSLILLTIICFVISFAIQISLYMNTSVVSFIKLYGLFVIVFCAGVIDSKRKIIPNLLIVVGLIFRTLIYIYEVFFVRETLKSVFFNDMIGFAIGFLLLALVSFLSKGALGFGDAKLFGIIGITSGSFCTYSTLLASLIISVIVSIINIVRKKMGRKDSFPFGPCIAAGYVIVILLTSY